ncbi:MAG TPA: hypothetical protein VF885_02470 [Arthrobacter sp.]
MSGSGGTSTVATVAALVACMVLASSLAGCAYEDEGDPHPTVSAAKATTRPAWTAAAKDPDVLAVEARNYAELERRLATVPGKVLLADAGPADGPGVGFRKAVTVKTAGPHTVTVTCVGIPAAQITLMHDIAGGTEDTSFDVDCSTTQTRVVHLQVGHVGTQLTMRRDPGAVWTGAVAGIKITF